MRPYFEIDCTAGNVIDVTAVGILPGVRATMDHHDRPAEIDPAIWDKLVDGTLRRYDNLAQVLGIHIRYDQAWVEERAKAIGAWHPRRTDDDEKPARHTGQVCDLSGCGDPYYATFEGLDLCIEHFDQLAR